MPETLATVGRYHVARLIAHGGMGSLYLARDPAIDRLVAIKLLKDGFDDAVRERFAREARATGRLRHPNIVTVFDVGEHENRPFIAMEYVPGETLAQLITRRAPVRVVEKLAILEDLCAGLHYAHEEGIVHRDIKPANVILDTSGTLKILDFGIARAGESGITNAGDFVGTLNYMSPEQIVGENVDHRTDVYAVGAVAYELLSYRRAFPGTIQDGALFRILHSALTPLDSVAPGIDPEITQIIERAMAKEQDQRYQDLAALRQDLGTVRDRLVQLEPESDPDSDAETMHNGALTGVIEPYTPTPGRPSSDHTPSGSRGSSSGKRRTSPSSASRRAPASSARPAASIDAPASAAGPAVRRTLLLPLSALAGALLIILVAVVIWIGPWSRLPGSGSGSGPPPRRSETPPPPAANNNPTDGRRSIDEQVTGIRASARKQISAGQREQALDTLSAGIVLDPQDTELNSLIDELRRGAQQMAAQARAAASRRGATEEFSLGFREARALEREADLMGRTGERMRAVRSFWTAAGLYERASKPVASDIRAAVPPSGPARPESEKADVPPARPGQQAAAPPPAPAPESLKTLPGTVEKPAAPPVPSKPDPAPSDPPRSETADAAIRDTLRRYADAYRSRNVASVRAVMPSLSTQDVSSLNRDFSNYRSFDVVIDVERLQVDASAGTGSVTARVTRSFVTKTGVPGGNTVTQVFHLRKVDGSWIIERLGSR